MSRTKKNWDVLVDNRGNYDFLDTFKGGSGDKGIKGEKGEKGEYQPAFNYIGEVPTVGDLPVVPPPSAGDVHQIEADGSFWVYGQDGQWHQLTASITAVKGEKGEVGQKGEKGEVGEKGNKGEVGEKGNKGEVGEKGIKGAIGPFGEKGDKGNKGDKGDKGQKGEKGEVGAQGIKGQKGAQGQKGAEGKPAPTFTYKGEVPDFGSLPADPEVGDVYRDSTTGNLYVYGEGGDWDTIPGIQPLKGEQGDQGIKGQKGEIGPKGQKGEIGQKGEVGQKGEQGIKGEVGAKGIDGDKGEVGQTGGKGQKGEVGEQGIKGEVGEKGYVGRDGDKGEVGQKGQKGDMANIDDYYTKGEVTTILENYYTKGETYDRGYIDAKFNDRYTKGEVDALIEAAEGSYYSLKAVPNGDNAAKLVFTDTKTKGETIIPVTATDTLGLEVVAGGLAFGKTLKEPLNYQGTITPPEDPANLEADPKDGYFFVYDTSGTAWNGEDVLAGNWVIYSEDGDEWKNIFVGVDPGVQSVTVSGGVLELEGTASDVVINLDKDDLEKALNDRYLRIDGTNNYAAQKLQFSPPDAAARVNLNTSSSEGFALTLNNSYKFTVNSNNAALKDPLHLNDGGHVLFNGDSGKKLDLPSGKWGTLASSGSNQFEWGDQGLKCHVDLNMTAGGSSHKIINLLDPTADQDAATKAYVDSKDYTLPVATDSVLGGVKVGANLNITLDGTLSVKTVDGLDNRYVKKSGDTMTGKLDIKMSNLNDVGLKVLGGLRIKRENDIDGKNALTVNHDNIVFEAKTTFKRPDASNNVTNLSIEGRRPNSTTNTDQLFTVYRVNDTSGDAINYYGRIQNASNIINKGHLDDAIDFTKYTELT